MDSIFRNGIMGVHEGLLNPIPYWVAQIKTKTMPKIKGQSIRGGCQNGTHLRGILL